MTVETLSPTLEATGRQHGILADVSSTTWRRFPALDMVTDCYHVYGLESPIAREAAWTSRADSSWA
ncbi:MAG: hypothetical protein ACRDK5_09925 [Solirubrobacterales bacterium]